MLKFSPRASRLFITWLTQILSGFLFRIAAAVELSLKVLLKLFMVFKWFRFLPGVLVHSWVPAALQHITTLTVSILMRGSSWGVLIFDFMVSLNNLFNNSYTYMWLSAERLISKMIHIVSNDHELCYVGCLTSLPRGTSDITTYNGFLWSNHTSTTQI